MISLSEECCEETLTHDSVNEIITHKSVLSIVYFGNHRIVLHIVVVKVARCAHCDWVRSTVTLTPIGLTCQDRHVSLSRTRNFSPQPARAIHKLHGKTSLLSLFYSNFHMTF